ncbi:polysaccharide biosynthesis protein [Methanoculleus sp.]|uniref:lipopolysaccharide biosynthesis protein n=1 Tax=Methanoculleus sp. TaxID=90427 RepID=UPI0025E7F3BC|nr:polysaccharide biosynthesis protein [Methanoculleus sp.]
MPTEISGPPEFKKEFSRNLTSNFVLFIVSILVGLLVVPFYIDTLGLAAYGIIPLATSFTNYVVLVLESLNAAISRFLTIHLQQSDLAGVTRIFNTALITIMAFVLLLAPVAVVIAWFTPDLFNIADLERESVFLLFALVFLSSLITALRSPFSAVMYALNKIHYINYITLVYTLASIGIIVAFFTVETPSVYYVGLAYFLAATLSLVLTVLVSRAVYNKIPISLSCFSRERFNEITGLARWILVDQIGTLLLLQLSLIIVNREFGTAAGGEYAMVVIFFNLLWSITGLITSVLSPMYYTYYARRHFATIHDLSVVSVKCVGLVMALPIALISLFSPQLLTIWVGEEFAHLSLLMWALLIPLTTIVAVRPLILSYAAYNRVRVPAIATIAAGLLNLVLAVALPHTSGLGMYGVAFAFVLALWLRNVVFVPWYAARVQGVSPAVFYGPAVPGTLAYIALVAVSYPLISVLAVPASVVDIALVAGAISLVYIAIVARVILTGPERDLIRSILPSPVSQRVPSWLL